MLISNRATNTLLVAILAVGIAVVAMLATGARGGPLDPTAAPASTMHTLDDSPVVWGRALPANDGADTCHSSRFLCVLSDAGVLDRETGLVWQRVPPSAMETWYAALVDCQTVQLGGRYGWRMPRIEEFRSLVDATGNLPAGNPFSNVTPNQNPDGYYSASTSLVDANEVYYMTFPTSNAVLSKNGFVGRVWCVRGGAGLEGM